MSTPESNGRKPVDADELDDAAAAAANDELDELEELEDESDRDWIDDEPSSSGLEIAFTPRQILGGFALLAALILLIRRRKRRE
jgi:hypothetical protein